MTTLTIQAADTASAMEEIARNRLGEDATDSVHHQKDGKVIMQATNGADLPEPGKPALPLHRRFQSDVQCRSVGLSAWQAAPVEQRDRPAWLAAHPPAAQPEHIRHRPRGHDARRWG